MAELYKKSKVTFKKSGGSSGSGGGSGGGSSQPQDTVVTLGPGEDVVVQTGRGGGGGGGGGNTTLTIGQPISSVAVPQETPNPFTAGLKSQAERRFGEARQEEALARQQELAREARDYALANPNNPYTQQQRSVEVSGGVAAKLAAESGRGQSVRSDVSYQASVQARPKPEQVSFFSVDLEKRKELQQKSYADEIKEKLHLREQAEMRAKNRELGAALSFGLAPAIEYAFNPQPLPGQETTQEQVVGREAFTGLLIAGGVGATAKPTVVSSAKVESASVGTVEAVESSESIVGTSRITGAGLVERKVLGIKLKPTEFKYTGRFKEVAKPIDLEFVGLQSEEQVYRTSGLGSLKVELPKKSLVVSSESTGFEVAGAGKRSVVQSVGNAPAEQFVETFVANPQGDKVVGSVVSRKGAGLFVLKEEAELSINKPGGTLYFNPETGLKSATSTLQFNPDEVVTVKYFKEANLGRSSVPLSSEYAYEAAGKRLRKNIKPLPLEIGSGELATPSPVGAPQVLVAKAKTPLFTNLKSQAESVVKQEYPAVEVKLPVSVPLRQQRTELPKELSANKVALSTESSNVSLSAVAVEPLVSLRANRSVDLGVSPFQKIGSLNASRSKLSQSSGSVSASLANVGVSSLPVQASKSFSESLARQTPVQVNKLVGRQVNKLGLLSPVKPVTRMGVPSVDIPLFNEGGDLFGVDVRRQGVFKPIAKGVSLSQAIKLGAAKVRGTAAATYRVTKQGRPIITPAQSGFRAKGSLLIEQSKYRINQPGELREITFEGIKTNRKGRKGFLGIGG